MDTKLTDFTNDQLNTLLNALAAYTVDINNKIDIQNKYGIDLELNYKKEAENLELLAVQVINAKTKVQVLERINSN